MFVFDFGSGFVASDCCLHFGDFPGVDPRVVLRLGDLLRRHSSVGFDLFVQFVVPDLFPKVEGSGYRWEQDLYSDESGHFAAPDWRQGGLASQG